jgi:putative hemolysin
VVVVGITILAAVVGELVPKYVALSNPERLARYVAGPTAVFVKLSFIFSQALSTIAKVLVRLLGIRRAENTDAVSEEEINQMLIDGRQKGLFEETEEHFIRAVFEFTDGTVRRAMKPRTDVVAVSKDTPVSKIIELVAEHGYSRYPVYEDSIDHVIGVLHVKDLLRTDRSRQIDEVTAVVREPLFVPDSMPLPKLLKLFQSGKNHLAIVLDEFGGTAGIVTLEDTLEELVGEIRDEYDVEAPPIVKMSESMVYADGAVRPGEINRALDVNLPEDEADTVAGLFIDTVGHLPKKNESVTIADACLTVLARRENRILRLKIEKTAASDAS